MKMKTIPVKQAVTADSLFTVLSKWCARGSGNKKDNLRILTAFASGAGVKAIAPLLDIFLADGNAVEIIFGVDRKGTDRRAVSELRKLQRAHGRQVRVWWFQAPAQSSIFHPKLYLYEHGRHVSAVVGSANLTCGGLADNFESLILHENFMRKTPIAKSLLTIWRMFAEPRSPLQSEYLTELSASNARLLLKKLPQRTKQEFSSHVSSDNKLWTPLSKLRLPRTGKIRPREKVTAAKVAGDYLIMDILKETRHTQMQIPLDIVEDFFRVRRHQAADVNIRIMTHDGTTQPISRTLVTSQGKEGSRLMRRLEMPSILHQARPLAVFFIRLAGRREFAFRLIPKRSVFYKTIYALLERKGQQGAAKRRYIVGKRGDANWRTLRQLLTREDV